MPSLAILNSHPIQYFAPLYRRLAREPGIDLTVYFCSRQGAEEYLDTGFGERIRWDRSLLDGYHHKFLKSLRPSERVSGFWSLINPDIISELRRCKYDALWVNGHNHATYLIALGAAKVLGMPTLMRCETHLGLRRSGLKRIIRKSLMRFLYNQLCSACLPIGTLNREFYTFHGVKPDRMFTVPYSVDNEYFATETAQYKAQAHLKEELGLPTDKRLILFASKLLSRKRPMDLLKAFNRLCARGMEPALVFVGSGEEEGPLKNYVQENNLTDVYFFGFRNQSELPKFYSVADLFVFPSENEPWGLVLNEVMCAGLPIIAAKEIGAVPDLVSHGENGFIYESGNIEELTHFIDQILMTPNLAKRMGDASRKIVMQWDYERCVVGIKNALEAIQRRPRRMPESQPA